jgi:hypothetical protein
MRGIRLIAAFLRVQVLGGREMFELIEELKKVRRLAEEFGNGTLLYLLDMAIVEASEKASTLDHNVVTLKKLHEPRLRII